MDQNNIAVSISMDATIGSVDEHLEFLGQYNKRFGSFAFIDFQGKGKRDEPKTWACNQQGFVRTTVEQIKEAKQKGIIGLKFFKSFGLRYKNPDGSLIRIDDVRFEPIWKICGELQMPVLMHVADPVAFFQKVDAKNERWEELSRRPSWSFYGDEFPTREELLTARNKVIQRHPKTTFIGAHFANNAEDLKTVGQWLDQYPNLVIEFASRINELGRQPYTARKFFLKYQDRILFGTDGPWPELRLTYYWRFLETYDEYFQYSEKTPQPQGLWRIYGIGLPDSVLKKIYQENATRLFPGVKDKFDLATGMKGYYK